MGVRARIAGKGCDFKWLVVLWKANSADLGCPSTARYYKNISLALALPGFWEVAAKPLEYPVSIYLFIYLSNASGHSVSDGAGD